MIAKPRPGGLGISHGSRCRRCTEQKCVDRPEKTERPPRHLPTEPPGPTGGGAAARRQNNCRSHQDHCHGIVSAVRHRQGSQWTEAARHHASDPCRRAGLPRSLPPPRRQWHCGRSAGGANSHYAYLSVSGPASQSMWHPGRDRRHGHGHGGVPAGPALGRLACRPGTGSSLWFWSRATEAL